MCNIQFLLSLQFLEWLLQKVKEPSIIHDVLWLFNCSLSEHPVQQMVARKKAEEKGQKNSKVPIYVVIELAYTTYVYSRYNKARTHS